MTYYFDTSVIFAALMEGHQYHDKSAQTLSECLRDAKVVCVTNHLYAELYANLTRYPGAGKLTPDQAVDIISNRLSLLVETITLSADDYQAALVRSASAGVISGGVYDALHVQAAVVASAEVIYTINISDFSRLITPRDNIKLLSPV